MGALPRDYDTTSDRAGMAEQPHPSETAWRPACESDRLLDLGADPGEHVVCRRCDWPLTVPDHE